MSLVGIANVNVAKMVIDDLNDRGGLLGCPVELFVEDSATDESVAEVAAARLVARAVDVVVGGIYSSTRQAIRRPMVGQAEDVVQLPGAVRRSGVSPPDLLHRPVPAQQVEPFFPWLMQQTGAKRFCMPSADCIWPQQ